MADTVCDSANDITGHRPGRAHYPNPYPISYNRVHSIGWVWLLACSKHGCRLPPWPRGTTPSYCEPGGREFGTELVVKVVK